MKVHRPKNKNIWVPQNSDILPCEKVGKKKQGTEKCIQTCYHLHKGERIHLYGYVYIGQLLKAQETGNLTLR